MKRVIIVDDHIAIRKMLVVVLCRETGYEVVGQTGSGLEALTLCAELNPDLVILDLMLMELSGAEVIHRIREQSPGTRILIYSGTQNIASIRRCLQAEPDGFVEKFDDVNVLREALQTVTAGRKYFTALPAGMLDKLRYAKLDLTDREVEVLQLIAEGRFTKEIANRLEISFKTVENHRASLMHKISARNMADITRYAMRAGLIE